MPFEQSHISDCSLLIGVANDRFLPILLKIRLRIPWQKSTCLRLKS